MANVLNRVTLEYRESVNTPDFPEPDWIHNPDISEVARAPRRHWKLSGDNVVLMDAVERQAIDDALNTAALDSRASTLDDAAAITTAVARVLLDEINILRAGVIPPLQARTLAQVKAAIRGKMNG